VTVGVNVGAMVFVSGGSVKALSGICNCPEGTQAENIKIIDINIMCLICLVIIFEIIP
jgi:hypothetical protein